MKGGRRRCFWWMATFRILTGKLTDELWSPTSATSPRRMESGITDRFDTDENVGFYNTTSASLHVVIRLFLLCRAVSATVTAHTSLGWWVGWILVWLVTHLWSWCVCSTVKGKEQYQELWLVGLSPNSYIQYVCRNPACLGSMLTIHVSKTAESQSI